MRLLLPVPALLALALLPSPAPAGEEDPFRVSVNPLKKGLEGWERTGPAEKAFAWSAEESTLALKGQSGKVAPRVVAPRPIWDRFEAKLSLKKGSKKIRLVLQPVPPGEPVSLEIPAAVARGAWSEVALKVEPGKATLHGNDGKGERELATAALPAGARFRFGLEAPGGCEGAVGQLRLARTYDNEPQVCEEGFTPLFDGSTLGAWRAMKPEWESVFRAENGMIVAELRDADGAGLVLADRRLRDYELRFRALWTTSHLEFRALEVPGIGNQISRMESVHVNLTDNLTQEDWNEIQVRLQGESCTIEVNGKKILDGKVKADRPDTPLSVFVVKGKRFFLRDLRLRELEPAK